MSKIMKNASPVILLCGHGSRSPEAATEFNLLLNSVRDRLSPQTVTGAFLEFNAPSIPAALQELYDQGHRDIFVQPLTLYSGGHTKNDIPALMTDFAQSHPDVSLQYGKSLGLNDFVIDAAVSAINSVMPDDAAPEDCKLLVVGRGSDDRAITDQTITLCRKLHNRMGFGDSAYCYSFETAPLLPKALKQAAHSHYMQVIILPCLLFSGRLLCDIHREIDLATQEYPDFTFHKAPHLGSQAALIDAVLHHIQGI